MEELCEDLGRFLRLAWSNSCRLDPPRCIIESLSCETVLLLPPQLMRGTGGLRRARLILSKNTFGTHTSGRVSSEGGGKMRAKTQGNVVKCI